MNKGGFSWKRLSGLSAAKSRVSRSIGIPLTKSGRQRKIGRSVTGGGCLFFIIALSGLALSLALLSVTGVAVEQAGPLEFKSENGVATCTIAGKNLDEVWPAVLKTLIMIKWTVGENDKASGTISARKSAGKASWTGITDEELPGANFVLSVNETGAEIMIQWVNPRGGGLGVSFKKTRENFFKSFFENLKKNLK